MLKTTRHHTSTIQTIQRKNINGVLMMSILGILSDYPLFLVVPRHAPEFHGSVGIILAICLLFAIPSGEYEKTEQSDNNRREKLTWAKVIQV